MKVFIDGGYNKGQGLDFFIQELNIDDKWQILAFEPNKFLQPRHLLKNLKYFNKCLWTEDCINDFVIMRNE